MSKLPDIDALLKAKPSATVARQLVQWAADAQSRITRGDMMLGLLTADEVKKIPKAYQAAAEYGASDAWVTLAWWYANPQFGRANLKAAEQCLKSAIDAEVANAPLELVKFRWFYKQDTATAPEKKEAYRIVSDIVERDSTQAEAVYFLALLTTHGFGVKASPEVGVALQKQASDLGNSDALFELYIHYATGFGVAKDESAALQSLCRAAEAGHSRAMYNLGAYNASGLGMPKNIGEALKWYERAAEAGNPSAMVGLAVIYATGDGVEIDREYAEQMLDQADYCGLDVSDVREQLDL